MTFIRKKDFNELLKKVKTLESKVEMLEGYYDSENDGRRDEHNILIEALSIHLENVKDMVKNIREIQLHQYSKDEIIRKQKFTSYQVQQIAQVSGKTVSDFLKGDDKILYEHHEKEIIRLEKLNNSYKVGK